MKVNEPKFRKRQVVMLLDHHPDHNRVPSDPDYRVDTGYFGKITQVVDIDGKFWYDVSPSKGNSFFNQLPDVWIRALTGQEFTGRI